MLIYSSNKYSVCLIDGVLSINAIPLLHKSVSDQIIDTIMVEANNEKSTDEEFENKVDDYIGLVIKPVSAQC